MRRWFKLLAVMVAIALPLFFIFAPVMTEKGMNQVVPVNTAVSKRALDLHTTLFIADLHSDTLMWRRNLLDRASRGHVDLPRLQQGHVGLQVFSSVTKTPRGQNYDANSGEHDNITLLTVAQLQPPATWTSLLQRSLWHAEKLRRAEADSRNQLKIIRTQADLLAVMSRRNVQDFYTGALLSVEGLHNLEGKRENLDVLFKAGFRMAGLVHFFDNDIAGSMHGETKGGLTPLGRQVLRDMEAKGIIVDIAHSSHKAVADILAMAKRPVVSSHGGVQAVCKVNRNLTDDEIRGVARTGGVIGIGYWDGALCSTLPRDFALSVKHVRDLVGIDYVGLGSDFDGATTTGFDTTGLAQITQALIDAGFGDADIAKVMGGNVARVLAQGLPEK